MRELLLTREKKKFNATARNSEPRKERIFPGQRLVRPFAHLDEGWVAALGHLERLPCGDRLERRGGERREVALQRLARFRITIGQRERSHKDHMRKLVVRIDGDRPASQFNRLIVILQPEIGQRLATVPVVKRRIGRARQNRPVEIFKALFESPEESVVDAQLADGDYVGRVQGQRALGLRGGFLCTPLD